MTFSDRRRRFRAVLDGDACVFPASVFDPISTRIAEDIGYEVGMFAGSVASMTVLGAPDLIVLTLTEFTDQIRRMTRASSLPLLVDADHGYGNALSVMRTVQELEAAGVAALTIEDTALPKAFADEPTRLLTLEEGLGKIRAALRSRVDPSLAIVARTSAFALGRLEEGVARVRAYDQAGADALFLAGASSKAQIEAVRMVSQLPIICGVEGELLERKVMGALGIRIALQGHQPYLATIQVVHQTLTALRAGVAMNDLQNMPSDALVKEATRSAAYDRATKDFLPWGSSQSGSTLIKKEPA